MLLSLARASGSSGWWFLRHFFRTQAISYKERIIGKTILNRKNLIFLQQAFFL